jgi:Flp pilus assembly protein TadG
MLSRICSYRDRGEHGAIMVESALALIFYSLVIAFIIDAGLVIFRYSTLTSTGQALAHELGIDLGRAISTGTIGGTCIDFLNTSGNAYLTSHRLDDQSYSMTDPNATYSYAASVISDPDSPYAIIRIAGSLKPSCIVCSLFPNATIHSESSVLVEYSDNPC